jgi:Domain of Unknown Function (DUF748)
MEILGTVRSLPRGRKALLWAGIALLLYTLFGFLAAPPILKYFLTKNLSETLHREVRIEKVRVNPFVLSMTVSGFKVGERGRPDPFASFASLYGNLEVVSLFRLGVVLKEIRLEAPYVHITRNGDGKYNFSDLVEEFAPGKPPAPGEGKPPAAKPLRFALNNIQIRGGSVDFDDVPKETRHTVRGIRVDIPLLSNFPYQVNTFVKPVLEATVNGAAFSLAGRTRPFKDSLETSFDIDIRKLDVPFYLEYVPVPLRFEVRSATLDAEGTVSFVQYRDRGPTLGFSGKVAFDSIDVRDPEGKPLLRLPKWEISIASSELFSRKVRFSSILVQSPELHLARDGDGKIDVVSLLPGGKGGKAGKKSVRETGEEERKEPGVSIEADTIRVAGGIVEFEDASGTGPFRSTLSPIDLEIEHFSNADREKTAFRVSIVTESKETVKAGGEFTVTPPSSEGEVSFGKVRPGKYSPYFADRVLFDIADGAFDLSTRYSVSGAGADREIRLSGLTLALRSLRLKKRGERSDFLTVPALDLRDTVLDLSEKNLVIGEASSRKGVLLVKRTKGERWNLSTLLPQGPADGEDSRPREETGTGTGKPWVVALQKVRVAGYTVKVEDADASETVNLTADRIAFRGSNLSTDKGKKGRASLAFALKEGGSFTAEGDVGLDPAFARLTVAGKGLDIVPLQPYYTESVNIIVRSGAVFGDGLLSIAIPKDGRLEAAYTGDASLRDFASADKVKAEDFLNISSLDLTGLDVGVAPAGTRVDIARVGLTDFYSRIIIYNDAGINVRRILKGKDEERVQGGVGEKPEKPDEPERLPAAYPAVTVGKVVLQGGTINFSDFFVKPNFSANMVGVGGELTGLSSEEGRQAEVNLKGSLENKAPLDISGRLNPFPGRVLVDLKATFRNIDLVSFNPYAETYGGYEIRKGKLSAELKYDIVKQKLDARHHVVIDQLTLGDGVDSPKATTLPVRLAIALLKDRNGRIELDLPVTGDLSDPEFRIGGVILQILKNLLVKAATSPFALLGALVGGGEELSYVEFEYGSAAIPPAGEEKLSGLAKVLFDRPGLTIEIQGHVAPGRDGEVLRTILFRRKLKARKLKDTVGRGEAGTAVDNVVITPEEYPKYLKKAYKAETFPKPTNFLGFAKDIPDAEMEKLMYDNIKVTKDDLRLLALKRAQNVSGYLQAQGKIEANRLFLVEPGSLPPGEQENADGSRVTFRIR